MKIIQRVVMGAALVSMQLLANPQTVMEQYQTVCGDECAQTVARIAKTVSNQCQISFDGVMNQSLQLSGVHFVAMATAIGHPLASDLEQYAVSHINCRNLAMWSTAIQDHALVLESNLGLEGQNVTAN